MPDRVYARSQERIAALPRLLHSYNRHRPHASLAWHPHIYKIGLSRNYLLRLHLWASDITHLPMVHGFLYLVVILDVASRKVLAFRLSNTLTAGLCAGALQKAIGRFGAPEIFNTD